MVLFNREGSSVLPYVFCLGWGGRTYISSILAKFITNVNFSYSILYYLKYLYAVHNSPTSRGFSGWMSYTWGLWDIKRKLPVHYLPDLVPQHTITEDTELPWYQSCFQSWLHWDCGCHCSSSQHYHQYCCRSLLIHCSYQDHHWSILL